MAASHNGTETTTELEIEALINDVDEKEVSEVVSSLQKELGAAEESATSVSAVVGTEAAPKPFPGYNGTQDATQDVIDLTKPVKTEGQVSPSVQTANIGPVATGSATNAQTPSAKAPPLQLDGLNNATPRPPFAFSPLGGGLLPAHLQLTSEEQSAMYRQASLLAVSATAKSGGEKAKEILTLVSKVKDFLTHLIQLAGNSGPQVKTAVQALVQKLVVSARREVCTRGGGGV